jgi:hypothetical protein
MQQSFLNQNIDKVYAFLCSKGLTFRVEGETLFVRGLNGHKGVAEIIDQYKPGLMALLKGQRVNNFRESLDKGSNSLHKPFLEAVYRKAFYNFDHCHWTRSGATRAQKNGSDVIVYLTSDQIIKIDEKIRGRDFGDIALEHVSNDRTSSPGWMEKDLGIDYLNYAIVPLKRAYLLPWQQLKQVWIENKRQWLDLAKTEQDGFSIIRAPNETYITLSCAVPSDLLIEKIKDALVIVIN